MNNKTKCLVDGCNEKTAYGRKHYCEKHYMRLRRNGRTEKARPKEAYSHSAGYKILRCPEHPLAKRRGSVIEYEHRVIFYNTNGVGPFKCHWCGAELSWDNEEMVIDHLDSVRDNNNPDNLVASCGTCNTSRGFDKMVETQRKLGRIIEFQGKHMCLGEWAKKLNISRAALGWRIDTWGIEKALSTVAKPRKNRKIN